MVVGAYQEGIPPVFILGVVEGGEEGEQDPRAHKVWCRAASRRMVSPQGLAEHRGGSRRLRLGRGWVGRAEKLTPSLPTCLSSVICAPAWSESGVRCIIPGALLYTGMLPAAYRGTSIRIIRTGAGPGNRTFVYQVIQVPEYTVYTVYINELI